MENLSICSMNAYMNKNGVKLFALVAVIAMVFAGAAVMMSDDNVDAAWQMGGDIPTGDQTVAAGVDAVAISDFTITNNAKWTVKDGASFVINEGVTVTIEKVAPKTVEVPKGPFLKITPPFYGVFAAISVLCGGDPVVRGKIAISASSNDPKSLIDHRSTLVFDNSNPQVNLRMSYATCGIPLMFMRQNLLME